MRSRDIETPAGTARVHLHKPSSAPRAALIVGHGAGGGVDAPDIVAATDVANDAGLLVALVEQPYRVAGRRAPAPAARLDAAWISVIEQLREREVGGLDVIAGGRSMGARVACRTAAAVGAIGVLCLAFPLQPAARKGKEPAPSRQPELSAVKVPVLIVQGESDPFGMPRASATRTVARVAGDHGLKKDLDAARAAVDAWIADLLER
jgi:uncharacterized protein